MSFSFPLMVVRGQSGSARLGWFLFRRFVGTSGHRPYMVSSRSIQCLQSQGHNKGPLVQPAVVRSQIRNWNGYGALLTQVRNAHADNRGNPDGNEGDGKKLALPRLMEYPTVMWPSVINSIRNWFLTHLVIRPYFDRDFSIHEFMQGAHEAVSLVSTKMSCGQFDDLEGLVDPKVLQELRNTVSTFSVFQQDLIRVAAEDVFFSFPYQIGIIIPDVSGVAATVGETYVEPGDKDKPPPQTRHVEITVVLHVLRGMNEMQKKGETGSNFNLVDFTKDESNKYKVMVCNYRFFRDFTEGKDPTWIINMVNQFLPTEMNR